MTELDRLVVGTVGFDGSPSRTLRRLTCVELAESFRGSLPLAWFERLRAQAPPGFVFVVRASCAVSHPADDPLCRRLSLPYLLGAEPPGRAFDLGPAAERAWEYTASVAGALHTPWVFVQSSTAFRATAENEDRLASFVSQRVRPSGLRLVWDPQGAWPTEVHRRLCRGLDLIPAGDPLLPDEGTSTAPPGTEYLRTHGLARGPEGLAASDRAALVQSVRGRTSGFLLLHTPRPYRDASAILRALAEET